MHFLHILIGVYLIVLGARALTSWFPPPPADSPFSFITQMLRDLTEPVVAPARRIIPPAGNFDISFTIIFFAFFILFSITG